MRRDHSLAGASGATAAAAAARAAAIEAAVEAGAKPVEVEGLSKSYAARLMQLARLDLIVIDDWGLAAPSAAERSDLLELLDDRVGSRSTVITSQLPIEHWHAYLGDPTFADAILALETSHPDARYEWVSMSLADIRVPDDEWERVYGARAREMMEADILEPRATDAIGRAARD